MIGEMSASREVRGAPLSTQRHLTTSPFWLKRRGLICCNVRREVSLKMLDGAEVANHNTRESCWIVIDSKVYDVTSFLHQHPGGAAILLRQGGTVSWLLYP
jgi:cytochrome b involved in lipid metabolism